MYAHLGFYLMFLCLILSIFGAGSAFFAAKLNDPRLYKSSRASVTTIFLLTVIGAALMWYMLYQRDYSVAYIAKNSSNDLPPFYTLTAFWSSLEGSHFLWTLLLSMFSAIALWTASPNNDHIMPYVSLTLNGILIWMYYLSVSVSDPFIVSIPAPPNGAGMNALLQNYYMAFHPPTLFTGYSALVVPFAYGFAALCFGEITEGWLKTCRRWVLLAFTFLTVAIVLGGRWAYVELGWSGYWAWDPVENSSFLPWLFCLALMHSLIVQEKLGHLKSLTIVLSFLAFYFSFFGTFITRSGVISSVHSFAESNIGINYFVFLSILLFIFLMLFATRAHLLLPTGVAKVWGMSRESALALAVFLFITFAAIVSIGTLFPIVSEALSGQRVSVQAPYFNAFAPYIGLGVVLLMAIGNLMRFQSTKLVGGYRFQILALLGALIPAALFAYQGDVFQTTRPFALGSQIVGIILTFWCLICLFYDFYIHLKDVRMKFPVLFSHQRGYLGSFIAHVGFLVAILGFLGNFRGVNHTATVKEGEKISFAGYDFDFQGLEIRQDLNAKIIEGKLGIYREGHYVGELRPGRSQYPTKPELMHEVGILSFFWRDIYGVLSDFDREGGKSATFELHINHTVRFVWLSCLLVAIGSILAFFDGKRGRRSLDAFIASWRVQ